MAKRPKAKFSILVPAGEYEAGDVALSLNDQIGRTVQTVASISTLACASSTPGRQCRVEFRVGIDEDNTSVIDAKIKCPLRGGSCQETCDAMVTFLKSDYLGSLSFAQPIAFID